MKNIIYLIVTLLTVTIVVSCGPSAVEQEAAEKARRDSIRIADSIATLQAQMQHMKDSVASANAPIEKGVYKCINGGKIIRTGPGENYPLMEYDQMEGFPDGPFVIAIGDFVEATGRVKNGYAEVSDHLIEDESESDWGMDNVWIPVKCIKKIEKCDHKHWEDYM